MTMTTKKSAAIARLARGGSHSDPAEDISDARAAGFRVEADALAAAERAYARGGDPGAVARAKEAIVAVARATEAIVADYAALGIAPMPATLSELRRAGGDDAVRAALSAVVARLAATTPTTVTEEARALTTTPWGLRRAAARVGIAWPELPGRPGSAGNRRAKTPSQKANHRNRTRPVDTSSDRS